jgi:ABC-type transporter Mla maintaining outer membrane lipid asymmetry ATPase subunit MlaF
MSEPTPVIELFNADIAGAELRSQTVVIQNVSWTIHQDEYWVVGGLPGTGKTDLLVTAAGLQRPGHGMHLLFGKDLAAMPEGQQLKQRLRVGLVFQNGGRLFHQLSILDNLALPVCYHENVALDDARERVRAVLDAVELGRIERRHPGVLTRNLHERIALARALMLAPDVLLIDNPLASIDAREAFWWLDFLPRLAAGLPLFLNKRITLVVTTDDFRPWRRQGTHFALVHDKKWSILGDKTGLESNTSAEVRDVLAPEFKRKES